MATPKKRKFVDLVSDESSDPEQESPTQPTKKFKSQPCLTITQNCNQIEQMPDLEEDASTQQRKDENENKNYNDNTQFKINQPVQLYRDEILHTAKILEIQPNNDNTLYLIHYDILSSTYDEWVPTHKISSIQPLIDSTNNSNTNIIENEIIEDEQNNEQNEPEELPTIFNQRLLDLNPEPAKTFPFELDDFQFEGIKCLESENVNLLITAHTSAGKTVIAEYAIALALLNNQRVIYTSPIKALSNQKYREFTEKFGHTNIGLITGDVTKRRNASILVMTTEILRNMLYKGGSALREVAYVIFDEVHYMRDIERGVVWEESIILLNKKITLIFLSATLSNSDDFALWVTDLKQKECKIIGTEKRPIVLEHYVLPQGCDALYLVSSSQTKNTFIENNFVYAKQIKEQEKTYKQMDKEKKRNRLKVNELQLLLYMLYKNDWCPAIVFAFSKREVEGHALALNDTINFCTKQESQMIENVFNNAIDSLSDKDKQLPAVTSLLPLLKKGIGVHHGGILPILKEVTEILFQEGMIKVLFATETFAMGVNMPAKCVVFTAVEKFDGHSTRFLTSSEYIQMSGRAGRRGIDDRGIVIMMMPDSFSGDECKKMMCGKAGALTSSFRLTYNMLLKITKNIRTNVVSGECKIDENQDINYQDDMDGFSYQTVIEKSFYRFLMTQRIPQIEGRIKELRDVINEIENKHDFQDMKIYFDLYELRQKIFNKAHNIQSKDYIMNKYLEYGRVVFVENKVCDNNENKVWGWGIVLGFTKHRQPDLYFADILIPCQTLKNDTDETIIQTKPIMDANIDLTQPIDFNSLDDELKKKYGLLIIRFSTKCINKISSVRLNKSLTKRITEDVDYFNLYHKLQDVYKHFMNVIPELDVFSDINILSLYRDTNKIALKEEFEHRLPKLNERMIETNYYANKFKDNYDSKRELILFKLYKQYKKSKGEYNKLANKLSTYNVGEFAKELKCKCRVLKKLKYLNDENILTSKGIASSYLESNHEILITELMFDNFFDKLNCEEICSVLSVFILEKPPKKNERGRSNIVVKYPVPIIVHNYFEKILIKAREILNIKKECGLTQEFGLFDAPSHKNEDDYMTSFNAELINPIYQWVNGEDFINVNKLTMFYEGALIRFIKRLRDIINNLCDASNAIGNDILHKKFQKCIEKLQRGIVFAASLYVDDIEDEEEDDDDEDDDDDDDDEATESDNEINNDIDIDNDDEQTQSK